MKADVRVRRRSLAAATSIGAPLSARQGLKGDLALKDDEHSRLEKRIEELQAKVEQRKSWRPPPEPPKLKAEEPDKQRAGAKWRRRQRPTQACGKGARCPYVELQRCGWQGGEGEGG